MSAWWALISVLLSNVSKLNLRQRDLVPLHFILSDPLTKLIFDLVPAHPPYPCKSQQIWAGFRTIWCLAAGCGVLRALAAGTLVALARGNTASVHK